MDILGINQPVLRPAGGAGLRVDIPGEDEHLIPLHQDTYPMKTENCINFWVPLMSVTPESGAVKIYPKSHEIGAIPAEEKYIQKHKGRKLQGIPNKFKTDYPEMYASLDKGDVLAFHPYLLHKSNRNKSEDTRWTATLRYDDATTISWLSEAQNPYLDYRKDELAD
jgi:ectoine hydroxylase-related dioxygenase (phytanoyl-CoA dioxygenase family)